MTHLVDLAAIRILPNRQRRDLDDEATADLARSLRTSGLLHPPVCRTDPENPAGIVLVAGERRLRAISMAHKLGWQFNHGGSPVPAGQVPVTLIGELDAIAAEEAELEENVKRKDLTWQERAAAEARLHSLRSAQALSRGGSQTVRATAEEVYGRGDGYYQDAVRTNLLVAKHLADPDVAKAPSAKDALKVLKRKEEVARNTARAAELGAKTASELHALLNMSCLNWIPADRYDVVLSDPPYGIDASDFGDSGRKIVAGPEAHRYDDSYKAWQVLMQKFVVLMDTATVPQAHAYLFCDFDRFHELKRYVELVGWRVHRTPLIWHKAGNGGRVPWPTSGPRRHYEIILFAVKGDKPVNFIGPDVISVPNDDNLGHGAQKPVALYLELLRRSARAGDKVLDPFCGTGPIFPAAHEVKCLATGIELDAANYAIAAKRLGDLK